MHLICLILLVSFTILPVYAQNKPLEGNSANANQTDRSFCSKYLNEEKEICIESTHPDCSKLNNSAQCFGIIHYNSGLKYVGEINSNRSSGTGLLIGKDLTINGQFENGKVFGWVIRKHFKQNMTVMGNYKESNFIIEHMTLHDNNTVFIVDNSIVGTQVKILCNSEGEITSKYIDVYNIKRTVKPNQLDSEYYPCNPDKFIAKYKAKSPTDGDSYTAIPIKCLKELGRNDILVCSDKEWQQMVKSKPNFNILKQFNLSTKYDFLTERCNYLDVFNFWCTKVDEWSLEVQFISQTITNKNQLIAIEKITQVSCLGPDLIGTQNDLINVFGNPIKVTDNSMNFISRNGDEVLSALFEKNINTRRLSKGNSSLDCPGGMRLKLTLQMTRNRAMLPLVVNALNESEARNNKPKF